MEILILKGLILMEILLLLVYSQPNLLMHDWNLVIPRRRRGFILVVLIVMASLPVLVVY
jgi:hypothetical protein